MPELPEVEAVVHGLHEDGAVGPTIISTTVYRASAIKPQRPEEFADLCNGRALVAVERRAKNILLHLSGDQVIRVHLRMTGDLRIGDAEDKPAAGRIEWKLSDKRFLRFVDPRALGRVQISDAAEMRETLRHLGVEPLSRAFTAAKLAGIAQKSKLPAKLFLMDQSKIVGLGNIYAAEALFRAGISPTIPVNSLPPEKVAGLHRAIREVLRSAIQSVYKAYRSPDGYRNHRDDFQRMVYGRAGKGCKVCRNGIERIRQGGRSTYFCGHCQR